MKIEDAKKLEYGDVLHHLQFNNSDGTPVRWRVNGKVKTWKRDPDRVRIPVKHGLKSYDYVTERELKLVVREEDDEVVFFSSLNIGDTFDFVDPNRPHLNSFFKRCKKVSTRKYEDESGTQHTVGTVSCRVFHVKPQP